MPAWPLLVRGNLLRHLYLCRRARTLPLSLAFARPTARVVRVRLRLRLLLLRASAALL